MGLGDILGTISPAYGAVTGQGLGGAALNMSPVYLLMRGFGGASPQGVRGTAPSSPMGRGLAGTPPMVNVPNTQLPNLSLGSGSGGGPLGAISSALQGGGDFHSGAGMQFAQATPRQNGLASVLAALGMSI